MEPGLKPGLKKGYPRGGENASVTGRTRQEEVGRIEKVGRKKRLVEIAPAGNQGSGLPVPVLRTREGRGTLLRRVCWDRSPGGSPRF